MRFLTVLRHPVAFTCWQLPFRILSSTWAIGPIGVLFYSAILVILVEYSLWLLVAGLIDELQGCKNNLCNMALIVAPTSFDKTLRRTTSERMEMMTVRSHWLKPSGIHANFKLINY